jgi:hypothetical protein
MEEQGKVCTRCNILKPLEDFRKGGYASQLFRKAHCKNCSKIADKAYRDSGKHRENCKNYRLNHPDSDHNYYIRTKQYHNSKSRLYHQLLKNDPEYMRKRREYSRLHHARNKARYNAITAEYRTKKFKVTPKWADLRAIKEFYMGCPEGYEVDHIIPIRGELVSGFHVLENLQYLKAEDNRAKRNIINLEDITKYPSCKWR